MENKLMVLPTCPGCGSPMVYRPSGTKEQEWCGSWYECTKELCKYTTLLHSPALGALYEDYYRRHPDKRPKDWPANFGR